MFKIIIRNLPGFSDLGLYIVRLLLTKAMNPGDLSNSISLKLQILKV